ncbi:MAG TPA: histidine kinase dimerization/phosphoacceptor domain -containing protein [Rectinemataceae bacterium]|nr:histidine kinase dimerization/phosphoacceptor domain -containing protein [Rectinemataceae bacterium]
MKHEERKSILLVEDQVLIAMAEKVGLEKCGYSVLIANSGESAVELVAGSAALDLVLMDIDLGDGIDGTEAAQAILRNRDIPIVFLSSHTESEIVEKTEKISSYGYVVKNSGITILDASIKMAFKLFDAYGKTKALNNKLEATLNAFPDLLFEIGLDGYYYDFHSPHAGASSAPAQECIGKRVSDILPPGVADIVMSAIREAHETGVSVGKQYETVLPGVTLLYELSVSRKVSPPLEPHFMILIRDISARRMMEQALASSEMRYRRLFETAKDGVLILDAETGKIVDANPFLIEMLGYSKEQFIEKAIWEIGAFKDIVANKENFVELQRKEYVRYEDLPLETALGETVEVEFISNVYLVDGKKVIQCNIRNISDRKIAEELIHTLLAEKELILKEVHHRIKNNMSTIASLLSLQADTLTIPAAKTALKDAESRVQSMMVLYDKLFQSAGFKSVSVLEYLPSLIREILANFPKGASITVRKTIEDFYLDSKMLQPLGIIVNELLTNIMKYAFTGRDSGMITVSASLKGKRVHLGIEDDGNGMPETMDFANSPGFGLMLVGQLTKQLQGSIRIERAQGTKIVLEFETEGLR